MKLKFIILLITFSYYNTFAIHPINLSVGELVYKDKKIYLKFKFFTDDLQATLSQYCKCNMDIINKGINTTNEKCIEQYIASKFEVSINGTILKWTYKKSYAKESVVYVEYEVKLENINSVKLLKIKNTLLFDVIAEQKNILNINFFGEDSLKILKFDNQKEEYSKEIIYFY